MENVRSNVEEKLKNSGEHSLSGGMLNSPRTTSSVQSSGEELRRVSISLKMSQRGPGGQSITTMLSLNGSVTETEWNSKADLGRAAGVAVFSGVIQFSARARKWRVCTEA